MSGVYHEGDFRADGAWMYLMIINSFSQTVSFYYSVSVIIVMITAIIIIVIII